MLFGASAQLSSCAWSGSACSCSQGTMRISMPAHSCMELHALPQHRTQTTITARAQCQGQVRRVDLLDMARGQLT